MKTIKMSLANMQGKLSRDEMKNIMAGSGNDCQQASGYTYVQYGGVVYYGYYDTCGNFVCTEAGYIA